MNKYYKMASYANSLNDYLIDDALEASKYPFKQGAETTIKTIKNSNPSWGSEIFLKEIMSNCEIKKLVIDMKGYVDD